jgi:hypothetical protein
MVRIRSGFVLVLLCAAACGDPPTEDRRGYTKAPLENPGLIIRSDEHHPMREFGRPVLPEAVEVPASAAAAAAPAAPQTPAAPAGS